MRVYGFRTQKLRRQAYPLVLLLLLVLSVSVGAAPLDDYVNTPDTCFAWQVLDESQLPTGEALYQLSFTSQIWKGIPWQHRLTLIVPQSIKSNSVLMYIGGSGSGKNEIPMLSPLAQAVQAPVAILFDVPNQPLFDGLREDALISLTFEKFIETDDASWLLLLPMTKSAVRALDTIDQFMDAQLGREVDSYIVTGASKRGWTTWLTAAVDPRLQAIVPIAYDNLDLHKQMEHHLISFGSYAQKIDDYTERGLQQMLGTQQGKKLAAIVDPHAYRERYTLPKLIVRGSNDPYWPTDALLLYVDDLPGPTWIHNDPNGGHGLSDIERVITTIAGFFHAQTGALPLTLEPVEWNVKEGEESFSLEVISSLPAAAFNLWSAEGPTRDLREGAWSAETVGPGQRHTFDIPRLSTDYKAVYGEVILQIGKVSMALDTPIFIVEPKE